MASKSASQSRELIQKDKKLIQYGSQKCFPVPKTYPIGKNTCEGLFDPWKVLSEKNQEFLMFDFIIKNNKNKI